MKVFIGIAEQGPPRGQRANETFHRVGNRIVREVKDWPAATVVSEPDEADIIVTIGQSETSIRLPGPLSVDGTQVVRYSSGLPGSAAKIVAESLNSFLLNYLNRIDDRRLRRSGEITARIEELTIDLRMALDDNQALRELLKEARIEIDFLRRTVDVLSEATRMGRPSVMSKALTLVGGVLLAVATGLAEGASGAVLDQAPIVEFVERCTTIEAQLNELDLSADQLPTAAD